MDYNLIILIGGVLLFIIGLWLVIRLFKKIIRKRKMIENIPSEIVEDFNYAEEKMKGGLIENGTTTNPYSILWEVAKRNRVRGTDKSITGIYSTTSRTELPKQFTGRQDIQSRVITEPNINSTELRESKGNSNTNFWSKFRKQ